MTLAHANVYAYGEGMTSTRTLDISTNSLRDIRKALAVTGARITDEHTTVGAVGYTTITIVSGRR